MIVYFNIIWRNGIHNLQTPPDKKLSCYITFKQNFGQDRYFSLLKKIVQKRFTRFRISTHRLNIEKGRYVGIPRQEKYCTSCNDNSVDDEKHFLFYCNHVMDERDTLFELKKETCKKFNNLDNNNKLTWLMTNENVHY